MSEKALTFNNIRLNKKEFHKSKKSIDLMSIIVNQLIVPDKFKHNKEGLLFTKKVGLLNHYVLF